jgi:CBS domain-containing protein
MTPLPTTIEPRATVAKAARRMLRHRVKRLPVVDVRGRLVGIVSRSDVLRGFLRSDDDLRIEIHEGVIGRELCMDPLRFQVSVLHGVVTLVGQVERRSQVPLVREQVRSVDGVVELEDTLSDDVDDSGQRHARIPGSRL